MMHHSTGISLIMISGCHRNFVSKAFILANVSTKTDKTTLLNRFRQVLPAQYVLHDHAQLTPFECDALTAYRQLPLAVLLPGNQKELRSVVKICADHKTPIVTRGMGTGLSGGALPVANSILLVTTRLNRILDIDIENRQATVEPGVANLAISQAAAPYNLYYAPDPSSQIACSIGGNVAENSGGVHCLKYGLTVHNLLRIRALTMDCNDIEVGSRTLTAPGFDLLATLTGSEGMLAVLTEFTVKLLPEPQTSQVLLGAFRTVEDASHAVAAIIAHGIIPAGLEMMDTLAVRAVETFTHAGYPTTAAAVLICELDGNETDTRLQTRLVQAIFSEHHVDEIRTAANRDEGERLWAGRKAAFPAVGRVTPDYYCMDGTIPRRHLAEVLVQIARLSKKYALAVANVFHAGDGNLHPLIMYDAGNPDDLSKAESFGKEILELSIAAGGTISGEHGVGVEKLDSMCSQFTAAEIKQFERLKNAFDPQRLLNPGKAIPTLRRCAELGAMHVHHGKLTHPELSRF